MTADAQSLLEDVKALLRDLDFPAHKDDVVRHAQDEGADPDITNTLRQLPSQHYDSPQHVANSIPVEQIIALAGKFFQRDEE